jgi:probable F420-dependent oxidoreductase
LCRDSRQAQATGQITPRKESRRETLGFRGEKKSMRIGIGLFGLQQWFSGDFSGVLQLVRLADSKGVDVVSLTDHILIEEHLVNYPYGKFPVGLDFPWYDPITVLSAIAGVTSRIRLSAGVLVAPVRPAVLLAKQLATLDVMSKGRVEIGVGVGWQKAEYDASGIPFRRRYKRMEEQVEVCRLLWSTAPANYQGESVSFEHIHAWPRPVQKRIPLWFGLAPTERNLARIAKYGDGWVPMEQDVDKLAGHIANLRAAFSAAGRDPSEAGVRSVPRAVMGSDGKPNLDATLASIRDYEKVGVNVIEMQPRVWCAGPEDFDKFLDKIVAAKGGAS